MTATVGGYGLASTVTALLARLLPVPPVEATFMATTLSFAVMTAIVVWVFAARNALAAMGWVVGLALSTGMAAWLSIRFGWPA
ncbi:DUF3649 domain-containing protein [Niveispirillum fermenti]|uniref:DUF3649 domain-containing protein n=1 Tax=Niveispirillum fermenti TaxID=1233113 RepID=UPI003A87A367